MDDFVEAHYCHGRHIRPYLKFLCSNCGRSQDKSFDIIMPRTDYEDRIKLERSCFIAYCKGLGADPNNYDLAKFGSTPYSIYPKAGESNG